MRTILAILFFSVSTFAQSTPTPSGTVDNPVCGNLPNTTFQVKTDNGEHIAQPVAGKAIVYFLQDDTKFTGRPRPTTRLAVDGAWVGATHSDSYFHFPVDPGEHHLCAIWQAAGLDPVAGAAAAHFTAEAGHIYYFRAQNSSLHDGTKTIEFGKVDSDEARLLINRYALSSSSVKK
jgi:Protein of unknown function (DUF2846)